MILQTFHARTTKDAIRKARESLGPSACILEVARGAEGMRVVAATERPGARCPSVPDARELPDDSQQRYTRIADSLESRGFSRAAASRIAAAFVLDGASREGAERDPLESIFESLSRWLPNARALGPGERECVAIVGPPGSGKTSLIAKRAARLARTSESEMVLASCDLERLGGAEQLEAVARALGARFEIVRDRTEMGTLLARYSRRANLLIDTPGLSWSTPEALPAIAAKLSPLRRGEVELLLPADVDSESMNEAARVLLSLSPTRASVSRIDLALRPGIVISLLMSVGLMLESVSNGPRIPQDLEEVPLRGLARFALARGPSRTESPQGGAATPHEPLATVTHESYKEIAQ